MLSWPGTNRRPTPKREEEKGGFSEGCWGHAGLNSAASYEFRAKGMVCLTI